MEASDSLAAAVAGEGGFRDWGTSVRMGDGDAGAGLVPRDVGASAS